MLRNLIIGGIIGLIVSVIVSSRPKTYTVTFEVPAYTYDYSQVETYDNSENIVTWDDIDRQLDMEK